MYTNSLIMKLLIPFTILFVFVNANNNGCFMKTTNFCGKQSNSSDISAKRDNKPENCNGRFGGIEKIQSDLQTYVNRHLLASFELLLFSTYFDNHESSRPGFSKLYRKLSDGLWENSIETIKHVTKRNESVKVDLNDSAEYRIRENFRLTELESLGSVLDTMIQLAENANEIHSKVVRTDHRTKHSTKVLNSEQDQSISKDENNVHHTDNSKDSSSGKDQLKSSDESVHHHDGEIAHYMQEQLEHKADVIRDLSGHMNDVKSFMSGDIKSVALFMFDEYLLKS